jgi:hypothetical protein
VPPEPVVPIAFTQGYFEDYLKDFLLNAFRSPHGFGRPALGLAP